MQQHFRLVLNKKKFHAGAACGKLQEHKYRDMQGKCLHLHIAEEDVWEKQQETTSTCLQECC